MHRVWNLKKECYFFKLFVGKGELKVGFRKKAYLWQPQEFRITKWKEVEALVVAPEHFLQIKPKEKNW